MLLDISDLPAEDEALRTPLRALIARTIADLPTDRRARSWQGFDDGFSRELGKAGYLGLTMPEALRRP
jgi:alkylation response protein AidB-like acyl-CoA dehydrogenase